MSYWWKCIGPLGLVLGWTFFTKFKIITPLYLPSLSETIIALKQIILFHGADFWATSYRAVLGFFIAVFLAVPLGVIIGYYKKVYWSLEFVIDFFRSLPAPALFPLALLFFGIGDASKIAVAAFIAFWIILVNTIHGVWHTSQIRISVGKVFGANSYQSLRYITFYDALPEIFTGLRTGLSLALVLVIVAEMSIGTKLGLGQKIFDSYTAYRIPDMYGYILVVGLLGFLLNKIIRHAEKYFVHWNR
ncbi:MAG: ABC transporter permease [Patescibacteria group bacterium]|nr:ABC transporter permease [Patescibacteria group bacterium]